MVAGKYRACTQDTVRESLATGSPFYHPGWKGGGIWVVFTWRTFGRVHLPLSQCGMWFIPCLEDRIDQIDRPDSAAAMQGDDLWQYLRKSRGLSVFLGDFLVLHLFTLYILDFLFLVIFIRKVTSTRCVTSCGVQTATLYTPSHSA